MPALMPKPKQQYFGIASIPLIGGKIFTYAAGGSVPKATFTDAAGTVPQPNPIVLNARGEPPNAIFWDGSYRVVVQDALGNLIYSVDNYQTPLMPGDLAGGNASGAIGFDYSVGYPAGTIGRWLVDLALSAGSSFIGFIQAGIGAVARTVQDRLRDTVSMADFGPLGAADDTATLTKVINYLNANPGKAISGVPGIYITGPLPDLTASNVGLLMDGVTLKSKPNTLLTANDRMMAINGANVRIRGLKIDGDQFSYTAGTSAVLLALAGSGHSVSGLSVVRSPGRGMVTYCTKSAFDHCHIDDNAGLGLECSQVAGLSWSDVTNDRNGYGFQRTKANPADFSNLNAGFGVAFRFRSNDIDLTRFYARDNGRDGININQGSYNIRHNGCIASGNDDGGFTIASDNTGSGLPGEGEACYDLQYNHCIGSNNYTSGLVAYQPAHNVSVRGGAYFNNHRLAGRLAPQSSYKNGIYFAGGSTSIDIDTKAYDDRQTCVVTDINGSIGAGIVVAVTGWVNGTKNYYPHVVVLNSSRKFKGYANIVSEGAGNVTLIASAFNAPANIAVGDYISQCTQHNGVFMDNATQGRVRVDAWGEKDGPSDAGYKVYVGSFSFESNVRIEGDVGNEAIINTTYDTDLTNTTFNLPGGGTATQSVTEATTRSPGSLRLVGGTSVAEAVPTLVAGSLRILRGNSLRLGAWAYADAPGDARLLLIFNNSVNYLDADATHPGGGWRYLEVNAFVPANATDIFPRLTAAAGKTVYFDTLTLRPIYLPTDSRDAKPHSRYLPF